jgi:predicted TIM-barrel fold metal-dependent hydrolase
MADTIVESRTLERLIKLDPAKAAAMPKMVSADSHVQDLPEIYDSLPPELREKLPRVKFGEAPPGGSDPRLRRLDQIEDGVEAEILFPNYSMVLFGLDDVELQQRSFRIYNDWLTDFCRVEPKHLFGVPCISLYDVDEGIGELQRSHAMGMVGAMIWQVPQPDLPFRSDHYEKFWAAAAELGAPVNCHILTGHSYAKDFKKYSKASGIDKIHGAVNMKQADAANTLFDIIFSGALERHPNLKIVLAESEVGWVPFLLQQWDYYFERFRKTHELPIAQRPSELFREHVYCTFLEDFVGTRAFAFWGTDNCMWSNDYPHFNMTFPHSRENVESHLAGLAEDVRLRLVRQTAIDIYGLPL